MNGNEIYFDNASTTRVLPEVAEEVYKMLTDCYGNPSSLHRKGLEAEKRVKQARAAVARALGVQEGEIFFTSGGTEANNLAIFGAVETGARRGRRIITTKIEHPSVINVFKSLEEKGFDVVYLDVDSSGRVDLDMLQASADEKTILVSIMHVNNEMGTVQPIAEAVSIVRTKSPFALFHSDFVQSFCKTGLSPRAAGVDLATISSHKIHGPKGVGALYIKSGVTLRPCSFGGGQEGSLRPGTENTPGIVGFGKAADMAWANLDSAMKHIAAVKDRLAEGILRIEPDANINGGGAPHILSVSFPGVKSEVLLHTLEAHNIYVSSGSACSSKKTVPSYILLAMGLEKDRVEGAVRFSFSRFNTEEEVDECLNVLGAELPKIARVMARR